MKAFHILHTVFIIFALAQFVAAIQPKYKKKAPNSNKMVGRRSMGNTNFIDNEKAECDMHLKKIVGTSNVEELVVGSKGVAMVKQSKDKKAIACLIKVFEHYKKENGGLTRKADSKATIISNSQQELIDFLEGKSNKDGLVLGGKGSTSLHSGSSQDQSLLNLGIKDDGGDLEYRGRTSKHGKSLETTGDLRAGANMKGKQNQLHMTAHEETEFDSGKNMKSRDETVGGMKHSKKTKFQI